MKRYGRGGWYGNSRGHALAARGIKLYARKQKLVDPLFYAQKHERTIPFSDIQLMVKDGLSFSDMKMRYPDADSEDLRLRGIKAIESIDGDGTLSDLNKNGIDVTVRRAKNSRMYFSRVESVLKDRQKASFLPPVKVSLLRERLYHG